MNPYFVLGVPLEADDQTIRRAYLEAVKLAPPDLEPKRFQAINAAYEQIKDETRRNKYALFNKNTPGDSPLDVFVRHTQLSGSVSPLPFEVMKQLLRSCLKK
jgi:curved DNA-binding protein CbpA